MLTCTAERFYSKPRGYAGDFMTIELIYQNRPAGAHRLGPLIDRWFLDSLAAAAVRNRRGLLAREIAVTCRDAGDRSARSSTFACGPAEEIFDVLATPELGPRIAATLVDIDAQALDFVRHKAFMDYVLDWKLIHRDEADMHRPFAQSRFARPCTNLWFEEAGVNLFAECVKAAAD